MASKKAGTKKRSGSPGGFFQPQYFKVKVKLDPTSEVFSLKIYNEMKVKDIKRELEFVIGIPYHLQQLWYLDEAELADDTDVRHNHVVPDGLLHVNVRYTWAKLVQAVKENDVEDLFKLGVTKQTKFSSPNLEYLARWYPNRKSECLAERSFVALFMAAHRGRLAICQKLLLSGSNVNAVTSCGRSALHVAASRGHGDVMDVLLENGAKADIHDVEDSTPSTVALRFGHKDCDRHLFMFRWQQRAKKTIQGTKTTPKVA